MKYLLIIGDGMADDPVDALSGKTPLQYVNIPIMDGLAARGEVGSVVNCPEGLPPGSDTAILSIFGADPRVCYTGRSPLEAAGCGIVLRPGDVSYRCNMVALEDAGIPFEDLTILSHSAGSIEGDEAMALALALAADAEFSAAAARAGLVIHPNPSFRHIAVQSGAGIDGLVCTPPHDVLGQAVGPNLPRGCENAETLRQLMRLAHQALNDHPVNKARRAAGKLPGNGIWFWAEGTAVALERFFDKYQKTGTVISAVPLCHGIARLCGLDVTLVPGATGELLTNYQGKVDAAVAALRGGADFAAIHVEAPDECTHNGDLPGKLQAIEWLDEKVVGPLVAAMAGEAFRLLILSDHKTLTATRTHAGGAVPYLLYDSRRNTGRDAPYCEESGARGTFYPDGAAALMPLLFEL